MQDEIVERLAERARTIVLADPLDDETGMGPPADRTDYRLAAGVRTGAVGRAPASPIGSGPARCVTAYRVVATNVPFGGIGASGCGRENGLGVDEHTETKAVWIELSGATREPFRME